jgi:hypothetical protein
MTSVSASHTKTAAARRPAYPPGEIVHRGLLGLAIAAISSLILFLAAHGFSYYLLGREERPFSPMHAQLRSSGTLGLRLGILSLIMFGILFLYPLRKRWRWLSTIGSTRRWLNFHVLFGITTPIVVTFHTSFKWNGVAGLAYWIMIAVALSGFVGRYVYAKMPRSLNSVALSIAELEGQMAALAGRLQNQAFFRAEDLAPLLDVPPPKVIRNMNTVFMLWTMLRMDVKRPFQVSRLRRRVLHGPQRVLTLAGFLASKNEDLELIIFHARRQSRLRVAVAFLDRTSRIFHLWHIIHRPFSISFVALLLVHIGVVLSVGL